MLLSPTVQALLSRQRLLLADLLAHLQTEGAPPEAAEQARAAIAGLDESFLLVVVGEFNAGKSSFINALLGGAVLPEGVTPTTDRVYVLVHGEENQTLPTADPFVTRMVVPLPSLRDVALVDTPGTNAIVRQHQVITEGFLPRADLLLFLTSSDRPFTETERQFLELARRWGRSVVVVVNKADLLETEAAREQVRAFVETGARGVLGVPVPVHLVSARAEQRGGDPGFAELRAALEARLGERERTRLKLENPLAVAEELLQGEAARLKAARLMLETDAGVLRDLEAQRLHHEETMRGELDGQLNRIGRLLAEFQHRADAFIDSRLRFSNLRALVNSRELEAEFRREAVGDLPQAIDRQFDTMIDRFVESNLHFWEDVQNFLVRRQPASELARTRFSYDRAALVEGIAGSARRHLAQTTEEQLSRELARDAESAMKGAVGGLAGGLGLGATVGALVGGSMLDFTGGILFGLTMGSLGLFVLPSKRIAALRQLRERVEALRATLEAIVHREYEREQARADARLRDALRPMTAFVEQEQVRLERAEAALQGLGERLRELRAEAQKL